MEPFLSNIIAVKTMLSQIYSINISCLFMESLRNKDPTVLMTIKIIWKIIVSNVWNRILLTMLGPNSSDLWRFILLLRIKWPSETEPILEK